ncbi:hypothetical protein GCM10027065_22290 [Rhodanobacter koreensis]
MGPRHDARKVSGVLLAIQQVLLAGTITILLCAVGLLDLLLRLRIIGKRQFGVIRHILMQLLLLLALLQLVARLLLLHGLLVLRGLCPGGLRGTGHAEGCQYGNAD